MKKHVRQPRRCGNFVRVLTTLLLTAFVSATAIAGGPPNDACSTPTLISGTGNFPFDNAGATTGAEGQNNAACAFNGTTVIDNDVWFRWTATCDGVLFLSTCGMTSIDTKIAIYDSDPCVTPGVEAICCDDDTCKKQSEIFCDVICGHEYFIQIGTGAGAPGGTGEFRLDCQGTPCDDGPCCLDFNDGTTMGFAPCPLQPQVAVSVGTPGPSGDASDFYLRLRDLSGSSLACGPPCESDWSQYVNDPCGAFCFDFKVFEDGCVSGIPECVANGGWIPITPRIIISNGTVRAQFIASFFVTDAVGPNPGWVTVCAPLGPLDSLGNLPSNEDGAWVMVGGAPNSDWASLVSNVTEIQLPIDFTGNPAEIAGYDNICLRNDVCPCMEIVEEEIECELGPDGVPTGNYSLTFTVTNFSGIDAQYLLIADPNVTPNVISFGTPLPGDGSSSATVTVTISNILPGDDPFCFPLELADIVLEECCSTQLCVELPDCDCMLLSNVEVLCNPDGTGGFILNFDLTNLTPQIIEHMFLIPQPVGTVVTISPNYVDVPSLLPFTTQSFGSFTINGATPGEVLCIRISIHNEDLEECCSEDLCFTVPQCVFYSICDLDQNGVVDVADLLILIANWGPCDLDCLGDGNDDNVIDIQDLLLMLASWS